jgi:hypothetical protein
MAAMAELSLTLDLMGKYFKTLLYWNHLDNWKPNFSWMFIWLASTNLVFLLIGNPPSQVIDLWGTQLEINHWNVLYKLCVFYVDRNSKMTTTAVHSFYIGPIGSFYNQVNDTGSWEPLVIEAVNDNNYH